ncbi:PAS domain S-box protein [Halalkalicoccus tibetensis]|uniref:PAS domain S-box protein n=1 Tax=Halalkalicoccus tibetensis TaxID=175632 RepID=A0ABD5VAF4_9EURY
MTTHSPGERGPLAAVAEREAAVGDLDGLLEAARIGIARLTTEGTFLEVNDAFTTLTGYSRDELRGRPFATVLPNGGTTDGDPFDRFRAAGTEPATFDHRIGTAAGGSIPCETTFQSVSDPDGADVLGIVRTAVSDPTTDSRSTGETETAIGKSFLALANAISDGIIVLDSNSDIQYANPAVERILGYPPAELIGASKLKIIPDRLQETHLAALQRYLDTGERNINWSYVELPGQHREGHEVPLGVSLNTFTYGGARYFVGLIRDITPRKRAEEALATRLAQQDVAAHLGRRALRAEAIDSLLDEAVEAVAAGLDAEYAKVLELTEDDRELLLRAGVGWEPGLVGSATISATADDSQAGHTLSESHPIVVEDLGSETRFSGPPLLTDHGVRSGVSVTIGSPEEPWGILGVHDTRSREFTDHDVHFVETVAYILTAAISRSRHTRQLRTQQRQLAALNRLNALIHGIHRSIIKETSQAEIERSVCAGLVEKETYRFAAVWHADPTTGGVTPAAHAGHEDGYPDRVAGGGEGIPAERGPVGRAVDDRETYVVPDIAAAEEFPPWRKEALSRGYRSVAAVPIVYGDALFGVLSVYAGTEDAFGGTVRTVLGVLGETVGHAIATANQEQTLLGRERTVVTLDIRGYDGASGIETDHEGSFGVSRLVPVGDERYLLYGEGESEIEGTLAALEDSPLSVTDVTATAVGEGTIGFELELSDPPIVSRILAHGGRMLGVTYRGGNLITTIELPPAADVSRLVAEIEAIQPGLSVELHKRRTRSRTDTPATAFEDLTERQRAALETAYYSGYFEWPRENDGNAIAAKLGISSATFQQHFRAGQRKLLRNLLDGPR